MRTISLHRSSSGWTATFRVDGENDSDVVELFGTATVPTAFTAVAPALEVMREIERLNPGAVVTVNSNCIT